MWINVVYEECVEKLENDINQDKETKETVLKITSWNEDWFKDSFTCPACGLRNWQNVTLNLNKTKLCVDCFNERYTFKISNKLTHLELYDHPPMRCLDCLYQNFNVEITKKNDIIK